MPSLAIAPTFSALNPHVNHQSPWDVEGAGRT